MAKERISDARRFDYLKRIPSLRYWKIGLTFVALVLAALAAAGLRTRTGAARTFLSSGPLSLPHALWTEHCEVCHAVDYSRIPDSACIQCHDGPAHPAKSVDQARLNRTPACEQCHLEHQGNIPLTKVSDGNCTECHRDLNAHASGVKLKNVNITGFSAERHPEFSSASRTDSRPLKLNHAIHMPATAKVVRNIKLPMRCRDCHVTDRNSLTGNPLPVTFEQNCKSCHAKQLEFDVYNLLKTSTPAPHAKDRRAIHQFIVNTYQSLLATEPQIVAVPLKNDLVAQPSAAAWLNKVVSAADAYLFGSFGASPERAGMCTYCHEFTGGDGAFPVVAKVNRIQGRFVTDQPEGEPWLIRGEFWHRTHRSLQCESCHTEARASTKTSDVLIPVMKACLPCHDGARAAGLARCSECHLYHNKGREKEERRPTAQVLSALIGGALMGAGQPAGMQRRNSVVAGRIMR
jgi:hypothetical protein